jgi:hypothetical protein
MPLLIRDASTALPFGSDQVTNFPETGEIAFPYRLTECWTTAVLEFQFAKWRASRNSPFQ